MKKYPIVSIVGRQNTGKSTLFNAVFKKNLAITYDYPGVTRDVIKGVYEDAETEQKFLLCDTPGLDIENIDDLSESIIQLAFQQLIDSNVILFLIDKNDIRTYDWKLIKLFREDRRFNDKKILYVLNKADNPDEELDFDQFYRAGIKEIIPISALGRRNLKLLLQTVFFHLKDFKSGGAEEIFCRIAIVGKPNSGKSSLLNAVLGYERAAVSAMAGTTRDSVNETFWFEEKLIEIVDTAGIRKGSRTSEDSMEYYSYVRSVDSIRKADIIIHILDAQKGIGEYDKKIFSLIEKEGKPHIFAVNKWDTVADKDSNSFENYKKNMISRFPPSAVTPVISISATEKMRVHKLMTEVLKIRERAFLKFSTRDLNDKIRYYMDAGKLKGKEKKKPKVYYATQISVNPIRLILFVNSKDVFDGRAVSFLKKKFTEEYSLQGIPIQIEVREKSDKDK